MRNDDSLKPLSNHILPTASTMVGVCMTVISIIKLTKNSHATWADEILAINSLLFVVSAFCSYLSLRQGVEGSAMERMADRAFMVGLAMMAISSFILAFEIL